MKWLPDSMFGRLFLAVCVPIAIMLVTSYALVARDRRVLVKELGGSNQTVQRIAALTRELLPLSAAERASAITALNLAARGSRNDETGGGRRGGERGAPPPDEPVSGRGGNRGGGDRGSERSAQPSAAVKNALRELYLLPLQSQLGAGCTVTSASAGGRPRDDIVDLAMPPVGGRGDSLPPDSRVGGDGPGYGGLFDLRVSCGTEAPLVFRLAAPPELPAFNATLAWQLLALTAMLGTALYFATLRLTQPLTELQRAANAMGRAMPPPRIEARGAREIRESLLAFNTMQDRLRRYLDSRTRVLAAMSHDLRTPLTRLRLRVETVESPEARQRLVSDIEEMDSLVNRSLGMFRGLSDDEPTVSVNVNEMLANLSAEFAELGQTVPVHGVVEQQILARPLALKRALQNLIENAIKYGEAARIEVTDGARLAIAVCDCGPGIPTEQLEAVFEPFFRLEDSRNRDSGGVGLGLSIARDVAEMHGGTLQLRNIGSGGLAATLILPRELAR
jgi:signal transduction histidine kinase